MRTLFFSAVLAVLPIAVAAATVTPTVVLTNPSMYDGQSITVSGTVSDYETKNIALGNIAKFSLCDTKCITVLDKTQQSHSNGSTATITGTFHASYKAPNKTWTNVLMVGF